MEREPILIIIRDGSPIVCSLDTTQEVYVIDQRGCSKDNPPTLLKPQIREEDVKIFRNLKEA